MIVVIADDFTGAAEIGGIGLQYGLNVVIETEQITHTETDLLVIDANTRSYNANEAEKIIKNITLKLLELRPQFIYKKIDSVLRGHVLDELMAQMSITNKKRALVIAANPNFKRIIKDGYYYINQVPLHKTSFSSDPEYPVNNSSVYEIVGNKIIEVYSSVKPGDLLPDNGLIIGDVVKKEDLEKWAMLVDNNNMDIAGASGFFNVLLNKRFNISPKSFLPGHLTGKKCLFVLGSIYPKDIDFFEMLKRRNYYISNMPGDLYYETQPVSGIINKWADEIVDAIEKNDKVVVTISHSPKNYKEFSLKIKEYIGSLTLQVFKRVKIDELLIEGGSTTSSILKYLNINKLYPFQIFDIGIIRMKNEVYPDSHITTKPGSYLWPPDLWKQKDIKTFDKIITN